MLKLVKALTEKAEQGDWFAHSEILALAIFDRAALEDRLSKSHQEPESSNRKLLIVVQDPKLAITASRSVEAICPNVMIASSGMEALSYLGNNHIDLIILDPELSKPNGYEMIKIIEDKCPYTSIILMFQNRHDQPPSTTFPHLPRFQWPGDQVAFLEKVNEIISLKDRNTASAS